MNQSLTILGRRALIGALALLWALSLPICCELAGAQGTDPLPSWNDGSAKQAILDFVKATTDKSSADFVPSQERIATFDQDGTLWVEHPMYTQVIYCLERVPAVVAKNPKLKTVEPFKTVLSGNKAAIAKLPMKDLEKILVATSDRHVGGGFQGRGEQMDRGGSRSTLEAPIHRLDLSTDAGGPSLSARQ